jgi:hypothetical protein
VERQGGWLARWFRRPQRDEQVALAKGRFVTLVLRHVQRTGDFRLQKHLQTVLTQPLHRLTGKPQGVGLIGVYYQTHAL